MQRELNNTESQSLFTALMNAGIINSFGHISLELLGVRIEIGDKSATGNLLQEWLGQWMTENGIYHRIQNNTQSFPDFFLTTSETQGLLEVKSFDYTKSPNFDIANFDTYRRSISEHAFRLDADYLIIGYELTDSVLHIRGLWLKNVWEICCRSERYPLRLQVKQNVIHNIRPYNFKNMSRGYQPFNSRREFVDAIKETVQMYRPDEDVNNWYANVTNSYRTTFGKEL